MTKPCSVRASFAARRSAPRGSSKVSPCQCSTVADSGNAGKCFRASGVNSTGNQPISWKRFCVTRAPSAIVVELRAETDADDPFARLHRGRNELSLRFEPGIIAILVDIHLTAHHDQQIELVEGGQRVARIEMAHGDPVAARLGPAGDLARAFGNGVLQGDDSHGAGM